MAKAKVIRADCREVLAKLPDNSIDSTVTDPPYELGFMGKGWDSKGIAYEVEMWKEVLRVLKPGGYALVFGGSRTYHRMACAIEDAGFEIVDSIDWIYGSGFPKALDISKAIDKKLGAVREVSASKTVAADRWTSEGRAALERGESSYDIPETSAASPEAKQWEGWKSQIKPAHEPVVVARKPFKGTFADNVLLHGTGAFNIDGCRVGTETRTNPPHGPSTAIPNYNSYVTDGYEPKEVTGRFPANVVFSHTPDCSEICANGCPVADLDEQSGPSKSTKLKATPNHNPFGLVHDDNWIPKTAAERGHTDEGGASRFFPAFKYQAKAPTKERPKVDGKSHATVKPLALMAWLVRLVTPPSGIVFEPFAGSGTTVQAALDEGFNCIAVEYEEDHIPLIKQRLEGYEVIYK